MNNLSLKQTRELLQKFQQRNETNSSEYKKLFKHYESMKEKNGRFLVKNPSTLGKGDKYHHQRKERLAKQEQQRKERQAKEAEQRKKRQAKEAEQRKKRQEKQAQQRIIRQTKQLIEKEEDTSYKILLGFLVSLFILIVSSLLNLYSNKTKAREDIFYFESAMYFVSFSLVIYYGYRLKFSMLSRIMIALFAASFAINIAIFEEEKKKRNLYIRDIEDSIIHSNFWNCSIRSKDVFRLFNGEREKIRESIPDLKNNLFSSFSSNIGSFIGTFLLSLLVGGITSLLISLRN